VGLVITILAVIGVVAVVLWFMRRAYARSGLRAVLGSPRRASRAAAPRRPARPLAVFSRARRSWICLHLYSPGMSETLLAADS
jgi:hypothetical protein